MAQTIASNLAQLSEIGSHCGGSSAALARCRSSNVVCWLLYRRSQAWLRSRTGSTLTQMEPPSSSIATTGGGRAEPQAEAITTGDPDLVVELMHGATIQLEPTSAPGGNIELTRFQGALLSLTSGHLEGPLLSFGEIDPDVVLYAFQLSDGQGSWNSSPFNERILWAYGPGSEHEGVGIHTPWWSVITVPSELAATLDSSGGPEMGRGERRLYAADAVAMLAGTIQRANTLIAQFATGSHFSHNFEAAVLADLADVLARGTAAAPSEAAAHKVVAECIEAATALGPVPSVAELAKEVGASDRWIRAAFNQRFGMPPSAWFRVRALHGARRELTSANRSQTSVTEIAMNWGFWHLGRFAGTYRRHFGEHPSETLKRPSRG